MVVQGYYNTTLKDNYNPYLFVVLYFYQSITPLLKERSKVFIFLLQRTEDGQGKAVKFLDRPFK